MPESRLFEYEGHWLVRRTDTPNLYIYWCRPGTRRVRRKSTGTGDLEQARRALVEFAHKRGRRPAPGDPDTVPVLDALADYVEHTMAGKPSASDARYVMGYFDRFFELYEIDFVSQLTLDVQEEYMRWRQGQGQANGKRLSNATINREMDVLRAALRAHWKRGHLREVPYITRLPSPPPRQRYLTADEFRRLLASCHEPHLWLYVMLAVHTLQRPGAILDLRCEKVDLHLNQIDFLPTGQVQTNKRRAVVPISRTLRPFLERAVEKSFSGYVVEYQGRPIQSIKKSFKAACDRAGLKGVHAYTLRHTGATLLAADGVPLREIAGMMGHTDTRTTEKHYAKHQPEFLQKAVAAVDRIFAPVPPDFGRALPAATVGHEHPSSANGGEHAWA